MKNIFYALLFFTLPCFAQTKILFDASKAQMCSNADWVIDADQHNIGTSGNGSMYVGGSGNESNPQRYPTPAQSGITQSTAETYWDGALSAWAVDLVKLGYEVESLPYNGTITYGNSNNAQDLSHYKVFISDEPNILFSSSEKTALIQFVQHGGGLFMIADHAGSDRNFDGFDSPQIWNDLMNNNTVQIHPFGMEFDSANFSQTSSNIATLPNDSCLHNSAVGNVTQIKISGGTSITLNHADNSSAKGLIFKTGASTTGTTQVLLASARYGNGKVAALTDSSPPDDGTGDPNDNLYFSYTGEANGSHRIFLLNTTIWLAATSSDTVSTGVEEFQISNSTFQIFPNPTTGMLNVEVSNELIGEEISLLDFTGRKILSAVVSTGNQKLETGNLNAGIYFLKMKNETRKFIKLD